MIVTIFRSRLRPEAAEEYAGWASRMSDLAGTMPGYLSHKVFTAEDGERVTVVEFESEEAQKNWATNPEHARAQAQGKQSFYAEYKLQVCSVLRHAEFRSEDGTNKTT